MISALAILCKSLPQISTTVCPRDTKPCFRRNSLLLRNRSRLPTLFFHYLSFFRYLFVSVIYCPTPPGGYLKIKNSLTLYALEPVWRREWDLNPRAPKGT